ncbi:hypothetical protein EON79_02235 [bacterium]|nr:MAG: hypothetical protein EON79_02235 [bacterium]
MAKGTIYVLDGERADLSRWLRASRRGGEAVLFLTDLCIPGRLSSLRQVVLPVDAVLDAAKGGDTQMNLGGGYVVLNGNEESGRLKIEFRGDGDTHATSAELRASELQDALAQDA